MGMPITVEIVDSAATEADIADIYAYFDYVDNTFSTYKSESEITRLNNNLLSFEQVSDDMNTVFALAEATKRDTDGYFDIWRDGYCDPSGIVKGWAIHNAALQLKQRGFQNFYVDAGGDIQTFGKNAQGETWRVGIRSPFNLQEIVKAVTITDQGVATSGNYVRGSHIYNPRTATALADEIVSLTVIGPNIYEADRFATAAFAMGREGIAFIANLDGFEGYMIDKYGQATLTSGFEGYVCHA